jgi:hypothetical protein
MKKSTIKFTIEDGTEEEWTPTSGLPVQQFIKSAGEPPSWTYQ